MNQDLRNLPARGILGSTGFIWTKVTASSAPRISDVEPDQVITTDDTTEALIRVLKTQRQGGQGKQAGAKQAADKQKRPLDNAEASKQKKQGITFTPPQLSCGKDDAHKRVYTTDDLKGKTVKELQDLLKARSMPVSGKKEALMQRIIDYQRRQKMAAEENSFTPN
ncbi:hypothetical protein CEUSTIGMA_g2394.t1 [Chlamydomonas eustigma]|uniref:SAP domain-containing protein n=1 Tax=Chlamydomonas eustigma TaxID=1157962 RepID=A0A250WVU6_9CHLO|nr:hypothetical protein CEUSTIGMA_g2394.t1 [Chlamydomonas eustigma]|eukprot:GAX74948.1 hypothetical protein CEUSTIGMA_g2394.t1 [Chlamydomonas eustigma]